MRPLFFLAVNLAVNLVIILAIRRLNGFYFSRSAESLLAYSNFFR
jgi:hypothetical protein